MKSHVKWEDRECQPCLLTTYRREWDKSHLLAFVKYRAENRSNIIVLGPWVKKNTWKGSHPSKVVPWQKEALAQSSSLVQEVEMQEEVGMVTQLHKSQENLVRLKLWNSLDKRTTGTIWYIVFSTGSVSISSKGHFAGSNSWQPRTL